MSALEYLSMYGSDGSDDDGDNIRNSIPPDNANTNATGEAMALVEGGGGGVRIGYDDEDMASDDHEEMEVQRVRREQREDEDRRGAEWLEAQQRAYSTRGNMETDEMEDAGIARALGDRQGGRRS